MSHVNSPSTSARPKQPSRHALRKRQPGAGRIIAVIATALLVFVGSGTALAYQGLQSDVERHDLDAILDTGDRERPTVADAPPSDNLSGRAYNVLIIGSDARDPDRDSDAANVGGMRSDTNLLMHISADRSRIDVVSIPRDLLVDIPSCPLADGGSTWAQSAGTGDGGTRFNAAFALGGQGGSVPHGAACTILTVEEMTGIYIDDFVVVDFDGFTDVIDALGGVDMCVDEDIDAPKAKLKLDAGCHTLDGETALGYARARVGVGDGSDIQRIGRQQELLDSIAAEVLDSNLLTDTPALYRFLRATASSMTTSERAGDLPTMAGLAYSLRNMDTENVNFVTVPFNWAGNVVTQNADGEALWESIRDDEPMALPDDQDGEPASLTDDEGDGEEG